jgi:hypothetical protein
MSEGNSPNPVRLKAEIAGLVAAARKHGELDTYGGKRRSVRVAKGMQLEVTLDTQNPTGGWDVNMHDVSQGGVAFWSKRDLKPYSYVFIREFSCRRERLWIPARVKHRTVGLRGFLIGVSFLVGKESGSEGKAASHPTQGPPGPPMVFPPGWRGPRR